MLDTCIPGVKPVPSTKDLAEARRHLDEAGVVVIRDALPRAVVAALRERLEEQAALEREQGVAIFADPAFGPHPTKPQVYHMHGSRIGRPKKDPPFQFVAYLPNKGRLFIELCMRPEFLEIAQHVLQDEFQVSTMAGLVVRKGAPAQFIHIDQSVVPFRTPRPILCNFMLPLSAFEESMGATRFVPGAHLGDGPDFGRAATGALANLGEVTSVPAEMEPGDVCFFDSRVWHGQGASTSDKTRWSVVGNYAVHWWRPYDNYPAILQDAVYEAMSAQERELFGFKFVRLGSGLTAPRSAEDRRYNTNVQMPFVPELRRGSSARATPAGEVEEW
jgi:ectoine hydroxylase-related dioxygenase (phytanoyl-CoA dioxygenase family)